MNGRLEGDSGPKSPPTNTSPEYDGISAAITASGLLTDRDLFASGVLGTSTHV